MESHGRALAPYDYRTWSRFTTEYNPLEAGSIDRTDVRPHDNAIVRALSAKYVPPKHLGGIAENTIFVARLNRQTKSDTLKKVFSQYGRIKDCQVIRNIVTGISRGYAFIEYYHSQDARRAYIEANQKELEGRKIFVDRELERVLNGWVPRRLGGGLGGRKESGQLRFGGRDRHFKIPYLPVTESSGNSIQSEGRSFDRSGYHKSKSRNEQDSFNRRKPEARYSTLRHTRN